MKNYSIEIKIETVGTEKEKEEALKSIIEYLIKWYCEVGEDAESYSIPKSFNRGTS